MKTSRNTNQKKNIPKYVQEKLAITILVITLALLALVGVLYNITTTNQLDYTQIVLSQQHYDSRIIPYRRGDIVDRNGTFLATSEKVYNLIIDPKQILSDEADYLAITVDALSSSFGYDKTELTTLIQSNKDKAYVRYARALTYDQKIAFETLSETTKKQNEKDKSSARIKGVWFEPEYKRIYPYNSLACNVVGFAQSDGMEGTGGIEQFYNKTLIGTNGREYGYLNDESNLERVIKPAVNGKTVVSTIDVNIQNIVEKHIRDWNSEIGSKMTGVVVMNPNNGEVLAMSSSSQFDLNNPRDLSPVYTEDEISAMDEATKVEEWNKMWRNHSVSDTFEPGSPSKAFTVATALEEGVINGSETYVCNGFLEVADWKIHCVKRTGHGPLTIPEAIMRSCNVVMMQIAAQTGKQKFYQYFDSFGFGAKTGIDLPGEADAKGLTYNEENAGPSDLATNSFGQNYNCTMIQMTAAFSSVINGGSYYTPHVAQQILNEQGAVIRKFDPDLVRETMSQSTSDYIKDTLFRTVSEGTGGAAKVPGYEVGGKTGTAEKYPRKQGNYVVSFIGFAPVDDPQVVVYVTIDEPNVEDQARSVYATQLFQRIMQEILPYMNVFPTTDVPGDTTGQTPPQEEVPAETVPGTPDESETAPETKAYETDEYVEPAGEDEAGDLGLPGSPPTAPKTEESTGLS